MTKRKSYPVLIWYLAHVVIISSMVYLMTGRVDFAASVLLIYELSGVVLYCSYKKVQERNRIKAFKKKIASFSTRDSYNRFPPRDSYNRWILAEPKTKHTIKIESTGIGEL